ncbi:MAG: alpha/beta hydrolase [Microcoleus sp. SIO2G3]|nr:alpha/beta hydrolase [Microcoleus sp. SIO2G3]
MQKQKLDWKIQLLDRLLSLLKPVHKMSLDELRKLDETSISPIAERVLVGRSIPLPEVAKQTVSGRHGEIPIQIYYPSTESNLALILFFHGGGCIYGNLQTHDRMCRRIARDTGAIVLAVRYHLAPFAKYPIPLEDCYDVVTWAVENATKLRADRQKIIVMGDSAGGNLATAVCLMSRDRNHPFIAQQVLLYPVTSGILDQPSVDRNANAPVLTKDAMQTYIDCYAQDESDRLKPYFSPLLAEDLSNLPPALIVTCEVDLLHDQAVGYARRLQEAGNQVLLLDYPGMVHGFMSFLPFCRAARPAFEQVAVFVRSVV